MVIPVLWRCCIRLEPWLKLVRVNLSSLSGYADCRDAVLARNPAAMWAISPKAMRPFEVEDLPRARKLEASNFAQHY